MGMTDQIARFAVETPSETIPQNALQIARLSLLDWLAVGIAGTEEPVSVAMRGLALDEAGAAQAAIFGSSERLPARAAAWVNGATSHALDYDDTHFLHIGHPSVVVASATMAVADQTGAAGRKFLEAYLLGCEASCRIGHWLGRSHYEAGFHQTATAGAFGATLAVARLLELDPEQTTHALGLTATRAAGLKSQFGTMGKPYNAGIAAANGVECALLAGTGFVSNPEGLDCDQGFYQTHSANGPGLDEALRDVGNDWVMTRVSHKFHACCHGTHAALEALRELRDRSELTPAQVAKVRIGVNPRWLDVCDKQTPETGLEAKFSYSMTSAMMLAGIDTGALDAYTAANCARPELVALRDLVEAIGDPSLTDTEANVEIATQDGRKLALHHDLNEPLPVIEREKKVRRKAASLLGASKAKDVWQAVEELDSATDVTRLARLMQQE